jgi:hypothetical protein
MGHFPNQIIGSNIPSQQTDYWIKPDGEFHKISQWPHPGSLRAETRYRNFDGQHDFPIATRYLVHIVATGGTAPTFFDDQDMWAWIDIDSGTVNNFEGESWFNPFLPRSFLQINHVETLETLQVPGTSLICQWFNSRGFYTVSYEWSDQGGVKFKPDVNTKDKPPDLRIPQNNDYGYTDVEIEVYAVSECYVFPADPTLPEQSAAFNGSDSYIKLTQNIPVLSNPFKMSADIRLHDTTGHWPLFGFDGSGGFTGGNEDDVLFGLLTIPTTWVPVLDVWFNWRFEFEQHLQLNYRVYVDDVQVAERTFGRQFGNRNTIGVYKHGVSGTIWANIDVKNLTLLTGVVPSSDVALLMPLAFDAQDHGPLENHGEAFNIDFGPD